MIKTIVQLSRLKVALSIIIKPLVESIQLWLLWNLNFNNCMTVSKSFCVMYKINRKKEEKV